MNRRSFIRRSAVGAVALAVPALARAGVSKSPVAPEVRTGSYIAEVDPDLTYIVVYDDQGKLVSRWPAVEKDGWISGAHESPWPMVELGESPFTIGVWYPPR